MKRALLALIALAMLTACESRPDERADTDPVGEAPAEEAPAEEPADQPTGEAEAPAGEVTRDALAETCPAPREAEGMCAQVITWALHPDTGECCQYPTPCASPEGWETFTDETACKAATTEQ